MTGNPSHKNVLSSPHNHKKSVSVLVICFTVFCVSLQISSGFCQDATQPDSTSQPDKGTKQEQIRMSRSAPSSSSSGQENTGEGPREPYPGRLFPPPTLKNKYQSRVARFHGGGSGPSSASRFLGGSSNFGYNSPIARMMVNQNTPGGFVENRDQRQSEAELVEDEETQKALENLNMLGQDPTFTPYISARALSNIPKFFEHLRANLEALQMDEDEFPSEELESGQMEDREDARGGFGLSNMESGGSAPGDLMDGTNYPEPKILRWIPASMGGLRGRGPNIRHFVQQPSVMESIYRAQSGYNPARNAYEFGLG